MQFFGNGDTVNIKAFINNGLGIYSVRTWAKQNEEDRGEKCIEAPLEESEIWLSSARFTPSS